jgi:hypothetical protein
MSAIGKGIYKVTADDESSKLRTAIRVSNRPEWKGKHVGAVL